MATPASLAGWRFAQDELDSRARRAWLAEVREAAQVDVFASTHTCLAALRDFSYPCGRLTVINNGAAGMPNFASTRFGVITRICHHAARRSARSMASNATAFTSMRWRSHYDHAAFVARFLRRWPPGSSAHASYHARIVGGPDYSIEQAAPA